MDKKAVAGPKGQQFEIWVTLENGSTSAVKIVDTTHVDALRDAIKIKFAPDLDAFSAAKLVVKLSKDAEPLDPEAILSEVFKDVKTGKLRVYVELPKIEGPATVVRKRPLISVGSSTTNFVQLEAENLWVVRANSPYIATPTDQLLYLFLRQSARDELGLMQQSSSGLIYGPPGTGKSVVAWLFALLAAKQNGEIVLWRRYIGSDFIACKITAENVTPVSGDVEDATILILDGIRWETRDAIVDAALRWRPVLKNRKLYVITSHQLHFKLEDLRALEIKSQEVLSWTKEEYTEALKQEVIKKQVTPNLAPNPDLEWDEQVEDKYYLAGGSCRFMFHYSSAVVIQEIQNAVDRCDDVKLLLANTRGDKSTAAINTLIQITTKGRFIVSEHAMRLLSQKIETEFVKLALGACPNVAFDDWILEMDFLMQIKRKSGITMFDQNGDAFIWQPLDQKQFHDPSDLSEITTGWLVPNRWNQGGYDAVRVEVEEKKVFVQFVQITRAGTHSFKARFMNAMMNVIQQKHTGKSFRKAFYFVIPRGKEFKLPAFADSHWSSHISVLEFDRT